MFAERTRRPPLPCKDSLVPWDNRELVPNQLTPLDLLEIDLLRDLRPVWPGCRPIASLPIGNGSATGYFFRFLSASCGGGM